MTPKTEPLKIQPHGAESYRYGVANPSPICPLSMSGIELRHCRDDCALWRKNGYGVNGGCGLAKC
jgi:hypothetical protein